MPVIKKEILKKIEDIELINERMLIFEEYINKTDSMIVISDYKNIIVDVNNSFLDEMNYLRHEIIGRNIDILKSTNHSQLFYDNLNETINNGMVWKGDFHNLRKDGSMFWERATIVPIKINNYIKYFIQIGENIDSLKIELDKNKKQKKAALEIQKKLLSKEINKENIKIQSGYYPKNSISGDLYKWHEIEKGEYIILIADMLNYGIGSSLLTVGAMAIFENLVKEIRDPVKIIKRLNDRMIEICYNEKEEKQLFNALILSINTNTREIEYVNCGMPPFYLINDSKIKELACKKENLCKNKKLGSNIIKYDKLSEILLFTDGIFNIPLDFSDSGEILKNIIYYYSQNKDNNFFDILENEILFHYSNEISDDITAIAINLK